MLHRLYELKSFCKDHELINSNLFLNNRDWDKISSLVNHNISNNYNKNIPHNVLNLNYEGKFT